MAHIENKVEEKTLQSDNSNSAKDYGNDPYFVKKAAESKVFLEKHGFPKELLEKKYGKQIYK